MHFTCINEMRQDNSREIASLRAERNSAAQAKGKLERVLLEVLKGKKDLLAGAAQSVLAL